MLRAVLFEALHKKVTSSNLYQNLCYSPLNQATRDWHTRTVTLSAAKGLGVRFFAALRMTRRRSRVVKCTNVMWSDLAFASREASNYKLIINYSPTFGGPMPLFEYTCKRGDHHGSNRTLRRDAHLSTSVTTFILALPVPLTYWTASIRQ
jgi:hypothetical protein